MLTTLAGDDMTLVRHQTASNPSTPSSALRCLAADRDARVVHAAAANPGCPPDDLARLASSDDTNIRVAVAANHACPPTALAVLGYEGPHGAGPHTVTARVAGNPSTPADTIKQLATHPSHDTRVAAAANPSSDAETLEQLVQTELDAYQTWQRTGTRRRRDEFKRRGFEQQTVAAHRPRRGSELQRHTTRRRACRERLQTPAEHERARPANESSKKRLKVRAPLQTSRRSLSRSLSITAPPRRDATDQRVTTRERRSALVAASRRRPRRTTQRRSRPSMLIPPTNAAATTTQERRRTASQCSPSSTSRHRSRRGPTQTASSGPTRRSNGLAPIRAIKTYTTTANSNAPAVVATIETIWEFLGISSARAAGR